MINPLFISSLDGVGKSKSHDFTIRNDPEIVLDNNKDYFIALDSLSMMYSWDNISSSYNNNTIKYSHDSGITWTQIVFRNGNFSYDEINDYIEREIEAIGHSKTGIKIKFVPPLFRVFMSLEKDFQVDLPTGNFADLIGFNKGIVKATGYGDKIPDITRSVDNIYVHTDLVSNSRVGGKESDVLYRFSINNFPLSFPIEKEPTRALFCKMNKNRIKDLRIYITDGYDRPVDLNNEPVELTMMIEDEETLLRKNKYY